MTARASVTNSHPPHPGEERYRILVEAIAAMVWNRSPNGELRTPQPGWSAFTGQSSEALSGWGC